MRIYNRYTRKVIFECEKETIKETIIEARKRCSDLRCSDLSGSDLRGSNLRDSKLCNAKFEKTKVSYRGKTVEVNFTEIDSGW